MAKLKQIRRNTLAPDLDAAAIVATDADPSSTLEQLVRALLSQVKRIIYGNAAGNWSDDFQTGIGSTSANLRSLALGGGGGGTVSPLTTLNKRMSALVTAGDGDQACGVAITNTPSQSGYVRVFLNGNAMPLVGNVGTGACYFSGDGGATRRALNAIVAGDTLHWVGTVAGFQLDGNDILDYDYEES